MFEGNVPPAYGTCSKCFCATGTSSLCVGEFIPALRQSVFPQSGSVPLRKGSSGLPCWFTPSPWGVSDHGVSLQGLPPSTHSSPAWGRPSWRRLWAGGVGPWLDEPSLCLCLVLVPSPGAGGYQPHLQWPHAPETSFRRGCLDKSHSISSEIPILM